MTPADPHRRLLSARALEITLAWREESTRVGGRTVYTEGSYALSSPVSGERRESLPSAGGGPGLVGRFRVARSEIDPRQLDDWAQRVEVRVRVRIGGWRACHFVLPLRHS